MVNLYVGITDYDWFRFLSALPGIDEVNFWQPGGRTNFQALRPGELFLFKLHAPRNFIVGGGVFARADILPTSLSWEAFGASNGAPSLAEMRRRIVFYRGVPDDARQDYSIGCRVLTQPFLLPENQWMEGPNDRALLDDLGDSEGTSSRRQRRSFLATLDLRPTACQQRVWQPALWRSGRTKRQSIGPVEDLVRFEPPKPLSALKVFDLGRIKDDLDVAGELQQVPGFPIWKSQAALRIDQEVAQRVEEQVAGKIRNRDDAVRANPHKTRFAAAMRDIDLPVAGLARDIGCNEQSVRALDQCAYAIVCRLLWNTWFGRRLRGITGEGELPHLDVLRTIAVALFDNQIEPFVIIAADRPVQSIAAAGEQIDPQQPRPSPSSMPASAGSPGSRGMRMLSRWGLAARMKPGRPPRSVAQAFPAGSTAPRTTNGSNGKNWRC